MRFITAVFIFSILWGITVVVLGRYVLPAIPDAQAIYPQVYLWGVILYASVLTVNRLRNKG